MRFIPTIVHGIIDYIIGILVLASPWLFHYKNDGSETWGPAIIIAAMFAYEILTDYEVGLIKLLAMPAHLYFDIACGLALVCSPWIFDALNEAPHHASGIIMTFGIFITLNGLFTQTLPSYAEKRSNNGG